MDLDQATISYLIKQYIQGKLTEREQIALNNWLTNQENRAFFDKVTNAGYLQHALSIFHAHAKDNKRGWALVMEKINPNKSILTLRNGLKIAASILIILSFSVYFWLGNKKDTPKIVHSGNDQHQTKSDVQPGGSKATLTLANGRTIVLDSTQTGQIAQQGNTIIDNTNGQLVYNASPIQNSEALAYNTLATAKGQTYQVQLPDGSKVWLNAASSIRYPVAFTGKERRVTITGESYFEVAKDKKHPFHASIIANGKTADIEVLGTHFNVNAYEDEGVIKTTLLEGKVKIANVDPVKHTETILTPGEQAVLAPGNSLTVQQKADLEQAIAWKTGFFVFNGADLRTVMRQITRWYDLEAVYPPVMPNNTFSGKISRSSKLDSVFTILKIGTNLKFLLEGRKIIIRP